MGCEQVGKFILVGPVREPLLKRDSLKTEGTILLFLQYLQVPLGNMRRIHYLITIAPLLIETRAITVTNSMIWSKLL